MKIYYRKYGSSLWVDVSRFVIKDSLNSSDAESNALYQFSLSFFDPLDADDEYIIMRNGDDIAIVETSECLNVLDGIKAGCIFQSSRTPYLDRSGVSDRFAIQYDLTIEQRDFSRYPFKISPFSFDDNSIYQSLSTVLDLIFNSNIDNTRYDLGGVLSNGVVIPKYELLSPDTDIEIGEQIEGIARELLNDFLNQVSYKWSIVYYCEPHTTNNLNLIQQVQIWQD